jgi:hypothetical protein
MSENAYYKSVYNILSPHEECTNVKLKYEYMKLPIAHVVSMGVGSSNKEKIICCGCLKGMLGNEKEMTGCRRKPHINSFMICMVLPNHIKKDDIMGE